MARTRGGPVGTERCDHPGCGAGPFSRRGLAIHKRLKHGTGADTPPDDRVAARRESVGVRPKVPASEPALLEEGRKLVKNLAFLCPFVMMVLPVTGMTILSRLGDRPAHDPLTGKPIMVDGVHQTKRGIGSVVMDYARQDERILEGIRKFNQFFELEDAVELAASIGAAAAVDVMGVDPHIGLNLGPLGEVRPIESLIGDVVAELEETADEQQDQAQAKQPHANGAAPDGAAVVPGGVTET